MSQFHTYRIVPILTIFLLAGCAFSELMPFKSAYPGLADTSMSRVPATVRSLTPVVSPNLGAVRATLFYASSGKPIRRQIFYVATLIPALGAPLGSYVPALDVVTAPRGESDEDGNITISLVPPGQYALALMTPLGPILAEDSDKNSRIIFEVVAGQVTDLGNRTILVESSLLEP